MLERNIYFGGFKAVLAGARSGSEMGQIVGFVEPSSCLEQRQAESLLDFHSTQHLREFQKESLLEAFSLVGSSEGQTESLLEIARQLAPAKTRQKFRSRRA